VRDVDNVDAAEIDGVDLGQGAYPVLRADKDRNDQACGSGLESSPDGGFVTGMRDRSHEWLQRFCRRDQALIFLVIARLRGTFGFGHAGAYHFKESAISPGIPPGKSIT
jgi:hypothetical protein